MTLLNFWMLSKSE